MTDVQEIIEIFYSNLLHQVDMYERAGSGWVLLNLVYLDLNILEFDPLYEYNGTSSDESELDDY